MTATHCSDRPIKASYDRAALYHAVIEQEKETILEMVQKNVDWNYRDDNGDTVLHWAFDRKDNTPRQTIEVLGIFLDLGVDVNAKNSLGKTAMHLAVRERSKDVMQVLLDRGGDLNIADERGNSMAHFLVESEFKLFRQCACAFGSPDDRNLLERESVELIDWLMSKGLDVERPNARGLTALQLALRRNLQHVLPIFLKFAGDVHFVDEQKRTILHQFLESNRRYKDYAKRNETHRVAIPSYFYEAKYASGIVQILLDRGVSVDAVDDNGSTALHIAARMEEPDVLELLLERFSNVLARDQQGQSVLHLVIAECTDYAGFYFDKCTQLVQTLINKGADVHSRNGEGLAPLQLAARKKHLAILKILRAHSADFGVLTQRGESLLHLVARNMAEVVSDASYGEMVELLVREGCDVNAADHQGVSPLHVAAQFGSSAVARKLLQHGARVDCREGGSRCTPLHRAVEFEHRGVAEQLIAAGADVNARDARGASPLHRAARHFSERTVELLLRFGAHVDAADRSGRSPLDRAVEFDNPRGVEQLLEYGADVDDASAFDAAALASNEYMRSLLLDHWHKLRAADLPCADDYLRGCRQQDFKCSRSGLVQEVAQLKTRMIDKRTSFYDFLHMNPNRKSFYVQANVELGKLVNSPMLQLRFPRYRSVILASYRQALARYQLLKPAISAWYRLTGIALPNTCLEMILDNLSNVNLRRMLDKSHTNGLKRSSMRKAEGSQKKGRIE